MADTFRLCSLFPSQQIGLAGPAAGTAASLAMLLVGFGLSIAGKGDVTVDSTAFNVSGETDLAPSLATC